MTASNSIFIRQLKREALIVMRQPYMLVNSALFFTMFIVFFPLTLSPNPQLMRDIAPGLLWLAVLLAILLATERLLQQDYDDGVVEQWLISDYPLVEIISAKLLVNWLWSIAPLILLSPLLALLFNFSLYEIGILMVCIALGSPAIFTLCALAAAFSTGLHNKGMFMGLIILPLAIPVMIFASMALLAAMNNEPVSGYIALLTALSLISGCFMPFAISAVIRVSLCD